MVAAAILAVGSMTTMSACTPTRTTKSMGETIDDATLTASVKTALARDPDTSAFQVDVETFRGNVQLNGFVESEKMRTAAERVARSVEGVKKVENNLQVREGARSAGTTVDDTTITAKVKTALATDPDVAAHDVNVETRDGVVQLAGYVDSSAQKSQATKVAQRVAGVVRVDNQIQVKQR